MMSAPVESISYADESTVWVTSNVQVMSSYKAEAITPMPLARDFRVDQSAFDFSPLLLQHFRLQTPEDRLSSMSHRNVPFVG